MDKEKLRALIESIIFAADEPVTIDQLKKLFEAENIEADAINESIQHIQSTFSQNHSGIQLQQVAKGYQFRSKMEYAFWIQQFKRQKPTRLSQAALEVLSIIAYQQPATRHDIDQVRGVDSGGTLKNLLERELIRISGKKEEPGRPLLYSTTKQFLAHFSLNSLSDLPSMKEIEEMSKSNPPQEDLPLQ